MHARSVATLALLSVVLASCASPAATLPRASAPPPASPSGTAPSRPAFLAHAFTDVRDGTTFRLSQFSGKTVLVIGMAVW